MDAVWNYEDIYIVYTEKNCPAGLGRRFFMYDSVVLVLSFDLGQKKKKKKKKEKKRKECPGMYRAVVFI